MEIAKYIKENSNKVIDSKPVFFKLTNPENSREIQHLIDTKQINFIVDDYEEQQRELFALNNPQLAYSPDFKSNFADYYNSLQKNSPIEHHGLWVYFPWLSKLVHILEEEDFFAVRTSRNKLLIHKEEQEKFYNSVIGIGGLSLGSAVAIAIVLQGGAKHIKIADNDSLALSNINRIRAGVDNLGVKKVDMTARHIYEINPFAEVEIFSDGITESNIQQFFKGNRNLDIVIDEMDNMAIKYLLRKYAKENKLPVVMAADVADNGVIDIERYDLDDSIQFFHGRLGDTSYEDLLKLDKFGIGKTIAKHIGLENHTERMLESLSQMGKSIVSWPQLGGTAMLNGAAVAYCVRKIVNNQEVESNRSVLSLDEKLIPNYNTTEEIEKRNKVVDAFRNIFKI